MNQKEINAAVIVLYERVSDSIILTQRSEHLLRHPGEICFPGGTWDKEDENFYATALRELYEELGIPQKKVCLIKGLKTEVTLLGIKIHPWFAQVETIRPYQLNQQEVVRLISIPLSLVQDITNYKRFNFVWGSSHRETYEFIYNQDRVWGATARIMKQLVK